MLCRGPVLATILAAAAHVEHTLAEELELRGIVSPGASPPFERMIAMARGHLVFRPSDMLDKIDALRLVRNPLTHCKRAGHELAIGTKFRAQKRHPTLSLEEDAKLALEVMHGLFFATLRPFDDEQDGSLP